MGIIQGLTEFLPVSSSGHLALGQHLFGMDQGNLYVSVMLHGATLAATVVVFRKRLMGISQAVLQFARSPRTQRWQSHPDRILLTSMALTTLVTGTLGLVFEDLITQAFTSMKLVGVCLLCTGGLLWLPLLLRKANNPDGPILSKTAALGVGLAQAMAILPGISRSGSTLAASMLGGLSREKAGEYAFLISLPVIAGALLLEVLKLSPQEQIPTAVLAAGVISAFVTGMLALHFLLRWLAHGKLHYFSWYCWTVGLVALIFT